MPRPSPIGQAIYDEVEKLRADNPGMTQQAAFEALHEKNGEDRSVATIAANYYRMSRNMRGGKKRRVRRTRPVAALAPIHDGSVEPIDLDKLEVEMTEMTKHAVAMIRATKERLAEVEAMEKRLEDAKRALA